MTSNLYGTICLNRFVPISASFMSATSGAPRQVRHVMCASSCAPHQVHLTRCASPCVPRHMRLPMCASSGAPRQVGDSRRKPSSQADFLSPNIFLANRDSQRKFLSQADSRRLKNSWPAETLSGSLNHR